MNKVQSFGFGERLRLARIRAGLTQTQLAEIAGENGDAASKQAVSGWEAERHYPKANQLRAICRILNISADELLMADIREGAKIRQAEAAVQALTPEQRAELLKMMSVPTADRARVAAHIDPAPYDELHSDFGQLGTGLPVFHPGKQQPAKKRGIK